MQNLLDELKALLQQDERFVVDGKLLKNKIIELALQLDTSLIKILLKNGNIKKHFFQEMDNILVFDKIKFQKFISNKAFLPDSYTSFKNKIGLIEGDEFISESKDVVLAWPYKDCILEGGQTKEDIKRNEIFWNETLAPDEIDRLLTPKVFSNFKIYDKKGGHLVTNISKDDNFLLKGNNLLILYSLLKTYENQIKLIYIDPPYNTGKDSFGYNDKFNHSTWLTFMKNRLEVAKRLLHPEGAIFIQVDDKEMAYLKVLCDEIFERENFKECISIKNGSESGVNAINVMRGEQLFKVKEHILYYAKNNSLHRFNPLYIKAISYNEGYKLEVKKENNKYTVKDIYKNILNTLFNKDTMRGLTNEQKHVFYATFEEYCLKNNEFIYALKMDIQKSGDTFKIFASKNKLKNKVEEFKTADGRINLVYKGGMLTSLKERIVEENGNKYYGTLVSDFWWDIGATPSSEGNVNLKSGKKPERLLKRIIKLCTKKNDIILDFFLGSGSTAATAMKMGRRFIGIEQLTYGENDSLNRLINVINGDPSGISNDNDIKWKGGGSMIYAEAKSINENFIDKLLKCNDEKEIDNLFDTIFQKGFISYRIKDQPFKQLKYEYNILDIKEKKLFIKEMLDKNMLYLSYSEIDDIDFNIDERTKQLNHKFYANVSSR